jgi:branched-subunit amino acid aminotransferase/4-amino-4-deoxychorismate lyase
MELVYYKNRLIHGSDFRISGLNRAMYFGENTFTCFLLKDGVYQNLSLHLKRLKNSVEYVFDETFLPFKAEIIEALEEMKADGEFYFRITFYKTLRGELDFFIISSPHKNKVESITMGVSEYPRAESIMPSFVKVGNYMEGQLQLKEAKKTGFNELLFCSPDGYVLEASTSNVFIVSNGVIQTPTLRSGILDGVTREQLLLLLNSQQFDFEEKDLTLDDIENAQEIWLTNSIKGFRPVEIFKDKKLKRDVFIKVKTLFDQYYSERFRNEV